MGSLAYVECPSDRITFQLIPQVSPGSCGICGKGKDPNGFVDPRLDFEYYGSLIFCRDCTTQMAAIFGLISEDTYQDVIADNGILQANVRLLEEAKVKLEGLVDGFSNLFMDQSRLSDSSASINLPMENSNESTVIEDNRELSTSNTESSFRNDGEGTKNSKSSGIQGLVNL
jgi:hypothetical protein